MISSSTPSELPEHSLNLKAQEFDYAALDTETRLVVQQRCDEIKERLRDSVQATWDIGQRLVEVRDRLGYGRFYSWLKVEFEWSPRTAYNYISVFESFKSCATFSQVEIATSALYLLASPSTPEEARSEALERAKLGETITRSKAKEIASKHKKSAKPKATEPVMSDVLASVETSSTTAAEPEPAQHTKPSGSPINETEQLFYVGSEGQYVQTDSLDGLVSIEDELKQRAEHLGLHQKHNHSSPQTELANPVLFMGRLGHAIELAKRREDYLFAVLFLEIGCFKVVNLSLGHTISDQLLIAIARRLEASLRHGDTFARFGGDELTILLENLKDVEDATRVADRIQKSLTLPFNLSGHEVFTTASIGIALSTTGYEQPEDLLHHRTGRKAESSAFEC